jgi:hypothetical protein
VNGIVHDVWAALIWLPRGVWVYLAAIAFAALGVALGSPGAILIDRWHARRRARADWKAVEDFMIGGYAERHGKGDLDD